MRPETLELQHHYFNSSKVDREITCDIVQQPPTGPDRILPHDRCHRKRQPAPRTQAHRSRAQNPRTQIRARNRQRRSPGIPTESRGWERRRRDLNPRGAMHPYLLSREAHSTGLCDVSSADYSRTFLPRTRTAPATHAREPVDMAEGEGFEPPVPLLTQRFSRPSLSATQTALQTCLILQERAARCRQRGHRHRGFESLALRRADRLLGACGGCGSRSRRK